jgi:hypothetical protein
MRRGPVDDWLRVEVTGLRHPPRHSSDDAHRPSERRHQECRLQANCFGHESPKQRSNRHRTREDDRVYGQATSADPRRQEQVQLAGQHRGRRHPGQSSEHQGRNGRRKTRGPTRAQPKLRRRASRRRPASRYSTAGLSPVPAAPHRQWRHRRRDEQDRSEQDAPHDWFMPDIAATGAQRRNEMLPARSRYLQ